MRYVLVDLYDVVDFDQLSEYGDIVVLIPWVPALGMKCTRKQLAALEKHPLVKACTDVTEEFREVDKMHPEPRWG